MVTGREESTLGRGRGSHAETQRQSRRIQGLALPKQKSLEDVEQAVRKTNAAKCKTALETEQTSDAEVRTDVQEDAHQVSTDEVLEEASEAVAPSPPGQDVSPEARPDGQVELLSPVPEEKPVEDEVGPTLEKKLQPELEPSTELFQVEAQAETTSGQQDEQVAKAYTASHVSTWEQERSEQVFPPCVVYSWPRGHPDSFAWMNAALATSKYLASRAAAEASAQLWVHELAPDHRDLAMAQYLIGVQVPTRLITPRECVAILQRMLYEAGFQFHNLVRVWLRAHAAKVSPGVIRRLVANVQHLLAA
ncbi:hypothetical protein PHMEG_00035843 [Phytophthora megakarya]|uniref:Uncharacterized protein n=1 Tax=Phytophthora megakarya TaxID=4795 RepID=A0A225UN99_9STRA|nr:hypothetical protein PHMEG_00035843 [Phytophthora megakarya]